MQHFKTLFVLVSILFSWSIIKADNPSAVCIANVNVALGSSCDVTLLTDFIDGGSFDPDGDPFTLSLDDSGPYGPGTYVVIMRAFDSDGEESSSCFSTVVVEDKSSPVAVCVDALIVAIEADGDTEIFATDLDAGSFDNCPLSYAISSGPSIFTCADVGTTVPVTLTVTDAGGNSNQCFSTVEIQDPLGTCAGNTAPVAICVSALTANTNGAQGCEAIIFPSDVDAGSFDPEGDPITLSLTPSAPFALGSHIVTLTVSDGTLSNSCFTTLEVQANETEVCGDGIDNDCDGSIDEPNDINTFYEWIEAVAVNDLNNVSGNDDGYGDYTSETARLAINEPYPITLTPGYSSSSYAENWRVYIDLDRDGIFSHPDELLTQTTGTNVQTTSLQIPAGTSAGTTRMRVIMSYSSFQQSCGDNFDGEVEDYTVVIDECAATPNCINYCEAGGNTFYEWIENVSIGSINNTSGDNGGYGNYANLSTSVLPGTSYELRLLPGFSGNSYREYWRVWVDWNRDGNFDSSEIAVQGNSTSLLVSTLTVPNTVTPGNARMRIAMRYNAYPSAACGDVGDGEVEDYTLVIGASNLQQIPSGTNAAVGVERTTITTIPNSTAQLSLRLSPNPARDFVRVEITNQESDDSYLLRINDSRGRTVWQTTMHTNLTTLGLSELGLQPGMYFVSLETANQRLTERLIIK